MTRVASLTVAIYEGSGKLLQADANTTVSRR